MDFIDFKIIDAIDIAVVALLLMQIYKLIRKTAALTIFLGIGIIYLMWIVVRLFDMELLSLILGQVLGVGALALVVVFQQEIRRYLTLLGARISNNPNKFIRKLFGSSSKHNSANNPLYLEIENAVKSMSQNRVGALIVIEKTSDLTIYAQTGDFIDAHISQRLIESVFFKNSPLHDGAMIIRGARINSARCILPTSESMNIPAHLGLRHRAAIGLSEHADALIIVVSEETGRVSMVSQGELASIIDHYTIVNKIEEMLAA